MAKITLINRAKGAYVGLAVGDALGATVEFMLPQEIQAQYGTHDRICGGGWLKLKPGQVTDDTTMSLALGEAILRSGGRVEAQPMAQALDAWMRRKPVDIGNTVRRGLLHFRHTGETKTPEQDTDAGNGACMRTLPVALATFGLAETEIRRAVLAQAHITHNNRLSDAGTLCVVQMIHAMLRGASVRELIHGPVQDLITVHPKFRFRNRRRTNPSGYIVDTLQAVFQALFDTDNFTDCLIDVVNRGGDADTTGAIAGMLAGALYGIDAIPSAWWYPLDIDVYRSCHTQAQALLAPALRWQTGDTPDWETGKLALAG